jgi:fermentation-respiration switch protein FrsA (DUF1100 family)
MISSLKIFKILTFVAGLLLVVYALGVSLLYIKQRSFVFHPDHAKPDIALADLPGLREVQMRTSDGIDLFAWYKAPEHSAPLLIFFHGNAGSLASNLVRARRFADAGLGLLLVEYRGYSGNAGTPSEEGFAKDAAAALAFASARGIAPDRLVLYGQSIGTGVAVRAAAQNPVGAVILESAYTSVSQIAAQQFPYVPVRLLMRDPFDSLSRIGSIHAPLLLMRGLLDRTVPPWMGQAMFDAAREPKQLWTVPDGGHNDLAEWGADDVTIAFIRQHVHPAPHH